MEQASMTEPKTAAAENLWRAVRDFLTAVGADDTTDLGLLLRMGNAHEIGVMVAVSPTPRIGIAGEDEHGRFSQTFELRPSTDVN
jgi:hypothetical protein